MTANQQIKAPVKWTQKGSGTRRPLERRSCDPKGFHGGLRFCLEWDQEILLTFKALVLRKVLSINRKTDAQVLLWTVQGEQCSFLRYFVKRFRDVWADYRQNRLQSGSSSTNILLYPLKFTIRSLFWISVRVFAYDLLIEECPWKKLARLFPFLVWYENISKFNFKTIVFTKTF